MPRQRGSISQYGFLFSQSKKAETHTAHVRTNAHISAPGQSWTPLVFVVLFSPRLRLMRVLERRISRASEGSSACEGQRGDRSHFGQLAIDWTGGRQGVAAWAAFLKLGSREGAAELGPDQTTQHCASQAPVRAEAEPGN